MPWWNLWSSSDSRQPQDNDNIAERAQSIAHSITSTIQQDVNNAPKSLTSDDGSVLHIFTEPQTIAAAAILTALCLGSLKFYNTYLRRIPEAVHIHQSYFHSRSIFGKVTRVGDGDNFRIYHTPGGRLAGWGWLPWRRVPVDKKLLKDNTIHIRIAGIDAPELAHFGRPAQPYSEEALKWLTSYVIGRRIRAYVYKIDQYSRVVATAYVRRGLLRRDVGLEMIKAGFATIYEAKSGAEFGKGLEEKYRDAEKWAKLKRKGMWAGQAKDYESPREYKNKYRGNDDVEKQ